MFATVWGGLGGLIERLVARVGGDRVVLDTPVSTISVAEGRLRLEAGSARHEPDAVVLATPAFESARLLAGVDAEASRSLAAIPYVSTATVYLVYPKGTGEQLPEGTGFVAPAGRGTVTACTWVSRKWPHDAFGDRAVLRCFVGRAGDEEALELPDTDLIRVAEREVGEALSLRERSERSRVVRWHRAMPQYEVGHLARVSRIEQNLAAVPNVFLTGAAYRGVGIADCVRQAKETADRVAAYLDGPRRPRSSGDQEQEAISWTS
jgi:oxygen-dependent protoporphyrinogen oxidase